MFVTTGDGRFVDVSGCEIKLAGGARANVKEVHAKKIGVPDSVNNGVVVLCSGSLKRCGEYLRYVHRVLRVPPLPKRMRDA